MRSTSVKIVLYILLSLAILSGTTFADEAGTPTPDKLPEGFENPFPKASGNQCIDPEKDKDKIVTFIEEPLFANDETQKVGDDFESRVCYRNTFSYTPTYTGTGDKKITGELKTISEVLNATGGCDNTVYSGLEKPEIEQFNVIYRCNRIQALISKGGTSLLEGYLSTIFRWSAGLVGLIAVIVIIISGIQISMSGGDSQAVENAKTRIVQSLAGIVVLFLSGLILYTVNPTFFTR